ncbi:putative Dynein heavy chain 17; axonemal [Paratrimastix pyriformis]|uniref:Dynein heavy chain 17 n=1 Tax=Paratrimastix pyriformis TaxID=342808 RepID=A0ABQ8UEL3_9EUKA|nr:putative Dynein heavy chain 17; axonemal [Paratrimastix pyriformis]
MSEGKADPRLDWLVAHVMSSTKLKQDKVGKLVSEDDSKRRITEFFDSPEPKLLVVYINAKDEPALSLTFPSQLKKKGVFFLKRAEPVGAEEREIDKYITFGDLSTSPLDQLSTFIDQLYLPMLGNQNLVQQWPEVLTHDVFSHIHKLNGEVQVSLGKMKGQTLLSLPPTDEATVTPAPPLTTAGSSQNLTASTTTPATAAAIAAAAEVPQVNIAKEALHQLESSVIEWSWQIKSITEKQCSPQYAANENPGPQAELDFWQLQATNLRAVHQQLTSEPFQKVARILEVSRNSYYPAFRKMVREVIEALNEANDNVRYLDALRVRIEKFAPDQAGAYLDLSKEFAPTMQTILLIYLRSQYLGNAKFLTIIIREFCNDLIEQSRAFLDAASIFKNEVPDSLRRLQTAIATVEAFTHVFDQFKTAVDREHPAKHWRVDRDHIFSRLFKFRDRLRSLVDLLRSFVCFVKLEKGEVGGPKGEDLTRQVQVVYTEFMQAMEGFTTASYDALNPEDNHFDLAYLAYDARRRDWSHRLGSLVSQGFETALTLAGPFKLLDTFDEVLLPEDRHNDLERHFQRLLNQFLQDIRYVEREFIQNSKDPPLFTNLPPLAGALWWSRGLADRLNLAMSCFDQHAKPLLEHGLGLEIVKYHSRVMNLLAQYQRQQFDEWASKIDTASLDKLELPLLRRLPPVPPQEVGQLAVNFSPALVALLREIKYLRMIEGDVLKSTGAAIPPNAMTLFEQAETFRNYTGTLDLVVEHYNTSIASMLPEEAPLVRDRMAAANEALDEGIGHLNWKTDGVGAFIQRVQDLVDVIFNKLQQAQKSVNDIEAILKDWAVPILRRAAEDRKLINPVEEREKYQSFCGTVTSGAQRIHELVRRNNATFDSIDVENPAWRTYLAYISNIVSQGLVAAIQTSLQYLSQHMETAQKDPLFEVRLQIIKEVPHGAKKGPKAVAGTTFRLAYTPDTDTTGDGSLVQLVNTWLDNFFGIASLVPSIHEKGDYLHMMQRTPELATIRTRTGQLLDESIAKCNELKTAYMQYNFLWKSDVEQTFKKFLAEGPQVLPFLREMQAEVEAEMTSRQLDTDTPADGAPKKDDKKAAGAAKAAAAAATATAEAPKKEEMKRGPLDMPPLEDFEREIRLLTHLRAKVEQLPDSVRHTWLRADARVGKADIVKLIDEWISTYQKYLVEKVTQSLDDLSAFIDDTNNKLQTPFNQDNLKDALNLLLTLRARTQKTDDMFEPLRATCALLKRFGIIIDAKAIGQLDTLPPQWDRIKRASYTLKDSLQQMMQDERSKIQERSKTLYARVDTYRGAFRKLPMFSFGTTIVDAYQVVDRCHMDVCMPPNTTGLVALEEQAVAVAKDEELFELTVHEYDSIEICRQELALVKAVWDMAGLVQSQFTVWKTTPWQEIETNSIEDQCKDFTKEVRTLRKGAGLTFPCLIWICLSLLSDLFYLLLLPPASSGFLLLSCFLIFPPIFGAFCFFFWLFLRGLLMSRCDSDSCSPPPKPPCPPLSPRSAWDVYIGLDNTVKNFGASMPLISELRSEAMRPHHWKELCKICKTEFTITADFKLENLLNLGLHKYADEVTEVVEKAQKEQSIEKVLRTVTRTWAAMMLTFNNHKECPVLGDTEEIRTQMETDQVQLSNAMAQRHVALFKDDLNDLQTKLTVVDTVLTVWVEVQRTWAHLETIFIGSADIRAQLPKDSERFDKIDADWREVMGKAAKVPNVVDCCNRPGLLKEVQILQQPTNGGSARAKQTQVPCHEKISWLGHRCSSSYNPHELGLCEKSLSSYLETKRRIFPRFYFLSSVDLLHILSNGANPHAVMVHLPKLFDAIKTLKFEVGPDGQETNTAIGMYSREDEFVPFTQPWPLQGKVEEWLEDVDYNKKQQQQLNVLVQRIQKPLSKNDRQKIMTIVTIDVHARDVIGNLIRDKVDNALCFGWVSQLRLGWNEEDENCYAKICDATFKYWYEFLGNTSRLVITPLTDRCYITLTQSLHLTMGGAPAGPAGTGKTETVKDLGRALAFMVYVFNCSEQMDFRSLGAIFKGLAQSGAWGCFDEFNRISIEVLSVVATQVKCILDAIKAKKTQFNFCDDGAEIHLERTCGFFITMNPGYAGRTELPENLKALFRPVSMVVPDFLLICEIMLMAEGFLEAKELAKKFTTLYSLNKELLSKQDHYDWGLRAIKSVLVVAGTLKRADPDLPEDDILMRALRDFNIPKIITEDMEVFMGLIGDLFPRKNPPRKVDMKLEETIIKVTKEHHLQAENNFVLKVVQLQELMAVRHSVFIIGPPGSSKTQVWSARLPAPGTTQYDPGIVKSTITIAAPQVWRMLAKANDVMGKPTITKDLNPKAVQAKELYGYTDSNKELKDGLFSTIMRDLANQKDTNPKWIILDGDIDPGWIESLNTVMDDNKVPHPICLRSASPGGWRRGDGDGPDYDFKNTACVEYKVLHPDLSHLPPVSIPPQVLTLASNERITLYSHMRLIFEIGNLSQASPATVSRAGILFINETDVGWSPFIQSWIDSLEGDSLRNNLMVLFDKYVAPSLSFIKKNLKFYTPMYDFNLVQTLCYMLKTLLTPRVIAADKEILEMYFVFACIWAFGGALMVDQLHDYRAEFNKFWRQDMKQIKLPDQGTIFDYCIDPVQFKFVPWTVPQYRHDPTLPITNVMVPTAESTRLMYWMQLLMDIECPILLLGNAGCGKTMLIKDRLQNLGPNYMYANINYNYYTDAKSLQFILEQPLVKLGPYFMPPGNKKLVYFVDDLNMPEVDIYGTQSPNTLLRQHIDYRHFYDRSKWTLLKEIRNTQYICAMNPTTGSFVVDPRLQRHFAVFAVNFPEQESQRVVPKLSAAMLDLHKRVTTLFLPTAIKFHYQFNMREIANVMAGLQQAVPERFKSVLQVIRLWRHESARVYADRLVSQDEQAQYDKLVEQVMDAAFTEVSREQRDAKPLLFAPFALGVASRVYEEVPNGFTGLKGLLDEALTQYNESKPVMNLVLFEDAMAHICRISRIVDRPRGNALLVGVGGSGKQSLARLAANIAGHEVFQITITSTYGVDAFKEDLKKLYFLFCVCVYVGAPAPRRAIAHAGVNDKKMMFLFTDTQITDEHLLVYINDVLSSGIIPDLLEQEDKDKIVGGIRNAVKAWLVDCKDKEQRENQTRDVKETKYANMTADSKEICMDYFINRVRDNLHVVLCFSPVGDKFRERARKFPALFSCTSIDWFHGWPTEALLSVARRFLSDVELGTPEVSESVVQFMAHAHLMVNEVSKEFLATDRRYNYTTPKSYLELISLYKAMLAKKRAEIAAKIDRLAMGLVKLEDTGAQVDELKAKLEREEVDVAQREREANELLEKVGKETAFVETQRAAARVEEENSEKIAKEVMAQEASCNEDLKAAEPAIIAAEAALNTLNKGNLTELKSLPAPPPDVAAVAAATMILMSPPSGVVRDTSWGAAKKTMNQVDKFLEQLLHFDKDHVPQANLKALEPYLSRPDFNTTDIGRKSAAAAGLCGWVINIVKYFNIYCDVQPKRERLASAQATLAEARAKLDAVQKKVAQLNKRLAENTALFEKATAEKNAVIAQAEATKLKLQLANRLVNGLSSEAVRWKESVDAFRLSESTLVGDVLLCAAFLSYIGPFTKSYRQKLTRGWTDFIKKAKVPMTEDLDPLTLLTYDAQKAQWNNEGLPTDRLSIENAVIVTNCQRWPLIIDPQLQGITWIKHKEGAELRVARLNQPNYLRTVEMSLGNGNPMLLENINENIDAVLDPVMGRNIIKKGGTMKIMLGDSAKDYNPKFKLFLQTKLSNPHYRPEIQAQSTLVNFTVTEEGLEDQLLALVVNREKPELERQKAELILQQNEFKIKLKDLEDALLTNLTTAQGDILSNVALIEQLEKTKLTAQEIKEKVTLAKETEASLNQIRESYRPVAARAALLYFLAFLVVFFKAMEIAPQSEDGAERALNLIQAITYQVFAYVNRGLFVKHKLIFTTQLAIRVLRKSNLLDADQTDYLIRSASPRVSITPCVAITSVYIIATSHSPPSLSPHVFIPHVFIPMSHVCHQSHYLHHHPRWGKKFFGPDGKEPDSPIPWLTTSNWSAVLALKNLEGFKSLNSDIEGSQKRWKEWCDHETPEKEKLPQDWKNKTTFERLLIIRALRPDRMMYAVQVWVGEAMGSEYVDPKPIPLEQSFKETAPQTPMFFVLSPGVDPVKEVEALGKKQGYTTDNGKFKFVSLGQGQEPVAEEGLDFAYKNGSWIMLENIHLMSKWLAILEKKLEAFNEGAHPNARVFLSAEPTPPPACIPQGILQACIKVRWLATVPVLPVSACLCLAMTVLVSIKAQFVLDVTVEGKTSAMCGSFCVSCQLLQIFGSYCLVSRLDCVCVPSCAAPSHIFPVTNEPPRGLKANMRRAFACFDSDTLEMCTKQNEFKSILFALCFFHGVILERRKFGPQGWNVPYPFNLGDLTISVSVLYNYLETNAKIPWDDLRYMFGEIMYGGHISDDWDRRLCRTYLQCYMQEELFNDLELGPGFPAPHPGTYEDYRLYIEDSLPPESPYLFGLHPNAEIGFLTEQAENLFKTILDLQPKDQADGGGVSREEKVNKTIEDIQQMIPENFEMSELYARIQERTPYTSVCLQECDRMNLLLNELRHTLKDLKLGLKGDLTMSTAMEDLMAALFIERVPTSWAKRAYPSLKGLPAWLADLQQRIRQLQEWSMDLNLPKFVCLSWLFNPQSFLTAVMQSTARKTSAPLDKMCLQTDITKKTQDEISAAPREGAYVSGLFLEGARLDPKTGYLAEAQLKELHPQVPIIFVKAVTVDKRETKDIYHCPVYMTRRRGPTFVWEFTLKTRLPESKWILAGVALLLSAE